MPEDEFIVVDEFCVHHQVDISFVKALEDAGLIEVTVTEDKTCVHEAQLPQLEKMVRLYYEMNINVEGIETVTYLLARLNEMQLQIRELENRLSIYEAE